MSTFTDACGLCWKLARNETTVDEVVKDWIGEKYQTLSSPVHRIPDEARYTHLLTVGRTGCGKSSFLYGLMAKDIDLALKGKRTLIFVDPVNGVDHVVKSARLAGYRNVFLIDPSDPDSLPRLNLFETGIERGGMLGTTYMMNTFKSVCAGLLDQELTPPMMTLFGYCAQVLMHVENKTLRDLMALLKDPIGFMDGIGMEPDDDTYAFFRDDVCSRGAKFADTAKYVRMRVHGFLNDPIMCRLLINKNPTMSIGKVIESGSILLIATRKTDVGVDGCRLLGKYIKAIVNRIVQERVHADVSQAVPIFFYEDEFQNSLNNGHDEGLASMLEENRKFKLSMNLATTRMGHFNTDMADALVSNTSTKICGTMVSKGAAFMAQEIGRTTLELKDLPNYKLYVKVGDMKQGVIVSTPKYPFKRFGKPDNRAMRKLQASMNQRFGTKYLERKPKLDEETSGIADVEM